MGGPEQFCAVHGQIPLKGVLGIFWVVLVTRVTPASHSHNTCSQQKWVPLHFCSYFQFHKPPELLQSIKVFGHFGIFWFLFYYSVRKCHISWYIMWLICRYFCMGWSSRDESQDLLEALHPGILPGQQEHVLGLNYSNGCGVSFIWGLINWTESVAFQGRSLK